MSGFDLVVNFIHEDLLLKDGFQIFLVDQVKVSIEGVWVCKKESIFVLAAKQCKLRLHKRSTLSYSEYPTWCPFLYWTMKTVMPPP